MASTWLAMTALAGSLASAPATATGEPSADAAANAPSSPTSAPETSPAPTPAPSPAGAPEASATPTPSPAPAVAPQASPAPAVAPTPTPTHARGVTPPSTAAREDDTRTAAARAHRDKKIRRRTAGGLLALGVSGATFGAALALDAAAYDALALCYAQPAPQSADEAIEGGFDCLGATFSSFTRRTLSAFAKIAHVHAALGAGVFFGLGAADRAIRRGAALHRRRGPVIVGGMLIGAGVVTLALTQLVTESAREACESDACVLHRTRQGMTYGEASALLLAAGVGTLSYGVTYNLRARLDAREPRLAARRELVARPLLGRGLAGLGVAGRF